MKPSHYKMKIQPIEYINWGFEEAVDNTTASQEVACTAGVCEI